MNYSVDTIPGQVLSRELTGGERLVWCGRPRQGIFMQGSDWAQVPFGLMFTGFSCYWEFLAVQSGNLFMILWGIPFILVGLYTLVGRFFWASWVRRTTFYGLTDQRAIIVVQGRSGNVKSIPVTEMNEVSLSDGPETRGTITFGPETAGWRWGRREGVAPSPQFEQIENGREVYNQILRLKKEAAR